MRVRVQINLQIKFENLVVDACRQGYEQAIAQASTEEEAAKILSGKIHDAIINPFFQSQEFKSAYDQPNPSPKKLSPLFLAKVRYEEVAEREIEETIKAAWQMTIELNKWNEQQSKNDKAKTKKLSFEKVSPSRSFKGLFNKKS